MLKETCSFADKRQQRFQVLLLVIYSEDDFAGLLLGADNDHELTIEEMHLRLCEGFKACCIAIADSLKTSGAGDVSSRLFPAISFATVSQMQKYAVTAVILQ